MLEENILKSWTQEGLIKPHDKIVVGVSGGPDSMCLLDLLRKNKEELGIEIVVAHINHQIRSDANADETYVVEYCNKYKIPIYVKKTNILDKSKHDKTGIEETGRKARYEFFEEILNEVGANKIATAHNKNDVAETVLMNIFRGAGINGLKSIEKNRNEKYIRPILSLERQEIEEYCKENQLNPRIDSTNKDNTYTRNKIRNIVIPYIQKEFNPSIIQALNRLSEIATEEIEYIEQQTNKIYIELLLNNEPKKEIALDWKKFNEQDLVIRKKLIFHSIQELMGTTKGIEKIHIDDIIRLCDNNIGNKYLIPQKHIKVLVKNKKIIFLAI